MRLMTQGLGAASVPDPKLRKALRLVIARRREHPTGGPNPDEATQIGIGLCRLGCFVGAGATSQRCSRLLAKTICAHGMNFESGSEDGGAGAAPSSLLGLCGADHVDAHLNEPTKEQ
jgi:hypothetical protein